MAAIADEISNSCAKMMVFLFKVHNFFQKCAINNIDNIGSDNEKATRRYLLMLA